MMDTLERAGRAVKERPVLTFPETEAEWVTELYGLASVILEYGSGGSTVLASENAGTTVFSVESDREWAASLQGYLDENPPLATVHLHPVDIGPTKEWGMPKHDRGWRKFHHYPISVWDREDFVHPDLILIDGRFRAACFMTSALRITKPVTLLFDDYTNRPQYHRVEAYFKPSEIRGRMARFDLTPLDFPANHMAEIMEMFTKPV